MTIDNRPVLYMMVGLPGCGKSTWINENKDIIQSANQRYYSILSTDAYIEKEAWYAGKAYNEVFKDHIDDATKMVNKQLEIINKLPFEELPNIFWDQTNLTAKSRARKLSQIPTVYKKYVIYFDYSNKNDILFKRNEERIKTGRNIPNSVLKDMMDTFEHVTSEEPFEVILKI